MPRRCIHTSLLLAAALLGFAAGAMAQEPTGTVTVTVTGEGRRLAGADVVSGDAAAITDDRGTATLALPAGPHRVTISLLGFSPDTLSVVVRSGQDTAVAITLVERPIEIATIVVSATRTNRMVKDEPIPVHVVPQEELEENATLAPGELTQMLNELAGARFQPAAPTLGGASLQLQGLPGRYTQVLVDGLPLYGEEPGVFELVQSPPLDLGRIEVVMGSASALYGGSALGGVLNLVSKRPGGEPGAIVSQTSRNGTDAVGFGTGELGGGWGWTLLAGLHRQEKRDSDHDGWANLPHYRRAVVRPRLFRQTKAGTLFATLGFTGEDRDGGTVGDAVAPDGHPFPESIDTRRVDGGLVVQRFFADAKLLAVRGSATLQRHRHVFGEAEDLHHHATGFAEVTLAGEDGPHAWVVGAALEADGFRSSAFPGFDHTWEVPAVFAVDDYAPAEWLTLSAAARLDAHSEFGAQLSPRLSALVRLPDEWSLRLSAGRGFAAPGPLVERTEEVGFSRLQPLGDLAVERATIASIDLHRLWGPLEVDVGIFGSRVLDPLAVRDAGLDRISLVNGGGPTKTWGSQLLAALHEGSLHLLASWVWEGATEADTAGGRRDAPLVPRHVVALDGIWEDEEWGRVGFETTWVGRQKLEDDPHRGEGASYWTVLLAAERRFGPVGVFASVENLGDVRQTDFEPLVRPARAPDGRWIVDAWAPQEGRTLRVGVRIED